MKTGKSERGRGKRTGQRVRTDEHDALILKEAHEIVMRYENGEISEEKKRDLALKWLHKHKAYFEACAIEAGHDVHRPGKGE